jgi:hypothetical protein
LLAALNVHSNLLTSLPAMLVPANNSLEYL